MLLILLLATQLLIGDSECRIDLIDSASLSGQLVSLDGDQMMLQPTEASSSEPVSVPIETVIKITRQPGNGNNAPAFRPVSIFLDDGSVIKTDDFQSDGKQAKFLFGEQPSGIAMKQVAAVMLRPANPKTREQWDEIGSGSHSGDVLVIRKGDNSLDYLEGVVSEITADEVKFQFEGDSIDVKR